MYRAAGCLINDIIVSHLMYSNISRGVHSRAVFVSLRALEGAAFIRGQRSFKGCVQLQAAAVRNMYLNVAVSF